MNDDDLLRSLDHCAAQRRSPRTGYVVATCSAHLHPEGTEHYDRDTGAVWTDREASK